MLQLQPKPLDFGKSSESAAFWKRRCLLENYILPSKSWQYKYSSLLKATEDTVKGLFNDCYRWALGTWSLALVYGLGGSVLRTQKLVLVVLVTPLILLHGYTRAGCRNWPLPSNLASSPTEKASEVSTAAVRRAEALRPRVRGWQARDPSPKAGSGSDLGLTLWSFLELFGLRNKNILWKERSHCLRSVRPDLNAVKT